MSIDEIVTLFFLKLNTIELNYSQHSRSFSNKLSTLCNNETCLETSVLERVGESFKDGLNI